MSARVFWTRFCVSIYDEPNRTSLCAEVSTPQRMEYQSPFLKKYPPKRVEGFPTVRMYQMLFEAREQAC